MDYVFIFQLKHLVIEALTLFIIFKNGLCIFSFFPTSATTHCVFVFCSPLAGL